MQMDQCMAMCWAVDNTLVIEFYYLFNYSYFILFLHSVKPNQCLFLPLKRQLSLNAPLLPSPSSMLFLSPN